MLARFFKKKTPQEEPARRGRIRNCKQEILPPQMIAADAEEENENEVSIFKSETSRTNLQLKWEEGVEKGVRLHGPLPRNPKIPSSNPGWSMVLIKDNHQEECSSLIFPPNLHENLHLTQPDHHEYDEKPLMPPSPSSSSATASSSEICEDESNDDNSSTILFSPSSDSNRTVGPDSPVLTPTPRRRHAADIASWVSFGLELLYSKVRWVFGSVHRPAKVTALATAAMVLGFLYFRWRRRRVSVAEEGKDGLIRMIREKDERINQLLNQIARMNDVLLALQRIPAASKG